MDKRTHAANEEARKLTKLLPNIGELPGLAAPELQRIASWVQAHRVRAKPELLLDRPISEFGEDLLGFGPVARRLAELLSRESTPLAVAITGEYGSGKTSFANLVRRALSKRPEILTVSVEAWRCQGIADMLFALSAELREAIVRRPLPRLRRYRALRLVNALSRTQGASIVAPSQLLRDLARNLFPSPADRLEGRVIVFVDDADRCSDGELEEMVRATRLLLSTEGYAAVYLVNLAQVTAAVSRQQEQQGASPADAVKAAGAWVDRVLPFRRQVPSLTSDAVEAAMRTWLGLPPAGSEEENTGQPLTWAGAVTPYLRFAADRAAPTPRQAKVLCNELLSAQEVCRQVVQRARQKGLLEVPGCSQDGDPESEWLPLWPRTPLLCKFWPDLARLRVEDPELFGVVVDVCQSRRTSDRPLVQRYSASVVLRDFLGMAYADGSGALSRGVAAAEPHVIAGLQPLVTPQPLLGIEQFVARIQSDPWLRDLFMADPDGALARAGIHAESAPAQQLKDEWQARPAVIKDQLREPTDQPPQEMIDTHAERTKGGDQFLGDGGSSWLRESRFIGHLEADESQPDAEEGPTEQQRSEVLRPADVDGFMPSLAPEDLFIQARRRSLESDTRGAVSLVLDLVRHPAADYADLHNALALANRMGAQRLAMLAAETNIEKHPTDSRALKDYVMCASQNGGPEDTARAERLLRQHLEQHPDDEELLVAFADVLDDAGRYEEIVTLLTESMQRTGRRSARILRNLARAYDPDCLNDRARARKYYEEAVAADTTDDQAAFWYALFLDDTGEYDKAERMMLEAMERDPSDARYVARYGQFLWRRRHDHAKALQYLRQALVAGGAEPRVRRTASIVLQQMGLTSAAAKAMDGEVFSDADVRQEALPPGQEDRPPAAPPGAEPPTRPDGS